MSDPFSFTVHIYKKEHVIYVGFTPICSLKHPLRVLEYVPSDKEDSYVFNYDLLHTWKGQLFLHTFYTIKDHEKQLCCAHAQDGYIIPMTQNAFLEQPSLLLPPQNVFPGKTSAKNFQASCFFHI